MRVLALALALATLLAPASLTAQAEEPGEDLPRILVIGWAGFSIREGQASLRFGDDLQTLGGRITLYRQRALLPWIQVDRFTRPDLFCPGIGDCHPDGTLVRAGFTVPLTQDDTGPGVHPRLVAGVGAAFVDAGTRFSYLLGLGAAWSVHPRLAPLAEIRWERVPGLRNIVMVNAGLRIGLL